MATPPAPAEAPDASTKAARSSMDPILTPLELPGWLEFNALRTGLEPHPVSLGDAPEGPVVRAVLYLDRRGRVKLPRGNPYLPVCFRPTRQRPSGRTAEWHDVAAALVDEMKHRGSANQLYLSPDVEDVRPWQWRGFFVGVRYTYFLDFPFLDAAMDREKRRARDRAVSLGMTVERVTDFDLVIECLAETEGRQGFTYRLGVPDLREARRLLGDDHLRAYVCLDRDGHTASTEVILHAPGARAVAWAAGTKSARLRDGAGHLVLRAAFDDLLAAGATGIDLCGANMPSVAAFKSHWGARLVTNYGVRTYNLRTGARILAEWRASRHL